MATPEYLAGRATEIADAHEKVTVEVLDREGISAAGMGGLEAVSKGGQHVEPRLITLRYTGRGDGKVLGLVGKSVTFDTGGISIKPSGGMEEMKMDMSGGAAVLEAVDAIASLDLASWGQKAGEAVAPTFVVQPGNTARPATTVIAARSRFLLFM